MVELAALEMLCTGNRTVGSNPTLSAKEFRMSDCGLRIADLRTIRGGFPIASQQAAIGKGNRKEGLDYVQG